MFLNPPPQSTLPEEISRALSPGEVPLWWGQPKRGLVLRGSDAFFIPFSFLWCGFAIFWEYSVLKSRNAPLFFVLWGLPFVAVGLFMVFGRFFAEASQRAKTHYAVTSQRVVIASGIFTRKLTSLNLKTLTDISLTENASGEGTITFGSIPNALSRFSRFPGTNAGPTFDLIPNSKNVYDIIRKAQINAK